MKPILDQLKRLVLNEKGEISLTKIGGALALVAAGILQQHLLPESCNQAIQWVIAFGGFLTLVGLRDSQTK